MIRPDFFDDAIAVLSVLIVTKSLVSLIRRRQCFERVLHLLCILAAAVGTFIALCAAGLEAPKGWQAGMCCMVRINRVDIDTYFRSRGR